jgi:ferredoxin
VTEDRAPGPLRVHVDRDKCQGHNRCYSLAPELFDVDDMGEASERGDGAVPPELVDKARRAVANCPEYAISITEVSEVSEVSEVTDSTEIGATP